MPPRNITELVLPWERIFAVPGLQDSWKKGGLIYVPPGFVEEMNLRTPSKWRVIVHDLTIVPLNPISAAFGSVDFVTRGSPHRPRHSIVNQHPTEGVLQFEHPTKIVVPEGSDFGITFSSGTPFFVLNFGVQMELFTERVAN